MSGGDKKYGRNAKRPSQKSYTAGQRWVSNKVKAIKRHTRRMALKAIHRIKWEVKKGLTDSYSSAARMQELRQIVSQNRTG